MARRRKSDPISLVFGLTRAIAKDASRAYKAAEKAKAKEERERYREEVREMKRLEGLRKRANADQKKRESSLNREMLAAINTAEKNRIAHEKNLQKKKAKAEALFFVAGKAAHVMRCQERDEVMLNYITDHFPQG